MRIWTVGLVVAVLLAGCAGASPAPAVTRQAPSAPTPSRAPTSLPAATASPMPTSVALPTQVAAVAVPRALTGNLSYQIARLEQDMPRAGSGAFVVPTDGEMAAFAGLVAEIRAGDTQQAASSAARQGYEVVLYTDSGDGGAHDILLRETRPIRKGWGLYAFREGGTSRVVIEAPHPLFDEGTPEVALAVYRKVGARALLIAGAQRYADADGSADVAHHLQTIFEVVHTASLDGASTVVLQIHGFESAKHPGYPQVVLGTDRAGKNELIDRLGAALTAKGLRAAACGGADWADLCGQTNIQSNDMNGGAFVHLELDETVRAASQDFIAALAEILGPAGQGVTAAGGQRK